MMKTFFSLLKMSLNVNFGISALKYRFTREKKKLWEPIGIGAGFLFGVGSIVALLSALMYGIFVGGQSIGHPDMVLIVAFLMAQFVVLIFGMIYLMGTFYFSKDMSILVPLPLKPSYILGSKFTIVMVNEYLTMLPVLLPGVIIYGAGTGQGILFWLKAIILILTAPIIPLAIGAIFVIVLMRYVNVRRSKDLLMIIGGFVGLLLAFGINFLLQGMPKGNEAEYFSNLLASKSAMIEAIGQKFPPSIWATLGLSDPGLSGFGYFALFIGVSVLLFAILIKLGDRIFYKGLLSGEEVTRKRKSLSKEAMSQKYEKTSNPIIALFWREWKLFIRTPIYVLNGLTGVIIGPFMAVMLLFNPETKLLVLSAIQDQKLIVFVTLAGLALMLFISGMNIVASTSLSREGKTFWISKMIPSPPGYQIMAKLLHSVVISVLGILTTSIVLIVLLKFSIIRILVIIVMGILGSLLISALHLIIDVLRPKLEWSSPQEAVKRNLNVFFGMIVSLLVMALLGLALLGMILLGLQEWIIYSGITLLIILMLIPSLLGLFALSEGSYKKIQV